MKQSIGFILLLFTLAYGIHEQSKPQEQKECTRRHYLDSCQYYVTKSSLTIVPQPKKYREKYNGVYELIE